MNYALLKSIKEVWDWIDAAFSIYDLVEDKMVETVNRMGDINYGAAVESLKKARTSSNPQIHYQSALTAFTIARRSFLSVARDQKGMIFKRDPDTEEKRNGYSKAANCSVFLAVLCKYLGDHSNFHEYSEEAINQFERYLSTFRDIGYDSMMISSNTGLGTKEIYRQNDEKTMAIREWKERARDELKSRLNRIDYL